VFLDVSNNSVGPDIDQLLEKLGCCQLVELYLNNCKLRSKGAASLFKMLKHVNAGSLGATLRVLTLANNDIHDPCAQSVHDFLKKNYIISMLDLGFNNFTNHSKSIFQNSIDVNSESPPEFKLYDLSINLIGNKCDNSLLEFSSFGRSKATWRYGINGRPDFDQLKYSTRRNYDHISYLSRPHHLDRVINDIRFHDEHPEYKATLNTLS
jgi:Ran GTPase-activating protein (RanGAP) involved in mRNA processing and transport